MAFRKYDTCFYERYAALTLQTLLGHRFDGLVNRDRPDLQSPDGTSIGIEVTRAMEGGKLAAQLLLKEMAGVHPVDAAEQSDMESIVDSGYAFGLQRGRYMGESELSYWRLARPLKEIIASKVGKVVSGFYGHFDMAGLYVFCQDRLSDDDVRRALTYTMSLQQGEEGYQRLYISDLSALYACNLEPDVNIDYRVTAFEITEEQRKEFYLSALRLD